MKKNIITSILQSILPILIPFFIFIGHVFIFGNYIIDDAGISFAYSRNLASGFGLVSQPGKLPVEGYSNFTWVVLMTPFFIFRFFDPIITPKIIGCLLTLITFVFINRILKKITDHPILGTVIVLLFLSVNTSFVMWAIAGLENSLYVFFVSFLVYLIIANHQQPKTKWLIVIGIIAALCALSRPDGVLFSLLYPGITLLYWISAKEKQPFKSIFKSIAIYTAIFLCFFGGYMVFRYFYFQDFYPNTYWAKGGRIPLDIKEWYVKIRDLLKSFGLTRYTLVMFIGIVFVNLVTKSVKKFEEWIVIFAMLISFVIYVLLPIDWMPEFRFATPFIFLFFLSAYLLIHNFTEIIIPNKKISTAILILIFSLWAAKSFPDYQDRTMVQIHDPVVSFIEITENYAYKFNEYADELNIKNGSLLIPDLGGTLYYSNLILYDLPGLADKTIARTLKNDKQAFYDYIFEDIKPTFIHTHKIWAYKTRFDTDPRFRRDYIPIQEAYDEWIQYGYREDIYSGDYIRKEAITDMKLLEDLQKKIK